MTLLGILTSKLGLLGIAFAAIILFYEGVPLGPLRMIPFVGSVLESVADGRVDRERRSGALQERQAWTELQRKLELQHLAKVKAQQAELDAISARYQTERAGDAVKIATLEAALAEEDKNAPAPGSRAFIPRSVSRALNAIGR